MQKQQLTLQYSMELVGSERKSNSKHHIVTIRLAQNGDVQAFEKLVKEYQQRVVSTAFKIVGSPEDAKDVAQEVFIRLYRFLPQFKHEKKFFTWLYRIVINASFDHLRRIKKYRSVPLKNLTNSIQLNINQNNKQDNEFQRIVGRLIETLSSSQKTAFILREVEGFSCKEISKIMDCTNSTVRSHLHFARKHLKDLLEKYYPEFIEGIHHEM